jgi:hypothetical protein
MTRKGNYADEFRPRRHSRAGKTRPKPTNFSPLLPRLRPHAINNNVCEVDAGVALDELSDSLLFKSNTAM